MENSAVCSLYSWWLWKVEILKWKICLLSGAALWNTHPNPNNTVNSKHCSQKDPKHVFFRSRLLFSCHTGMQHGHPHSISLTHAHAHTHTLACNLSQAQAYTHIPKPPTPTRHKSHLPLPRISCSSHIMLKWTCIIALAWFVVFVGGYQQPPWCLGQRWSLLQEPQIYIAALANMLFLWGPIV